MIITSTRFPIKHGFSTRQGGVSQGPYASLNLGQMVGDDPARVAENRRRLAESVGLEVHQFVHVHQVHGDRLLEPKTSNTNDAIDQLAGEADGLVTQQKGVALSIRTADCVPILLYAPDVEAIAAVHAGWRGTELAIARRAVEELARRYGALPKQVLAIIGPSIRRCCFQVGREVADRFQTRFGETVLTQKPDHQSDQVHVDLARANCLALREAGVIDRHIDVLEHCTACDRDRFFSHRRDQGRTGRHLSFVVL